MKTKIPADMAFAPIAPPQSTEETVKMFQNLELAIGWALEAVEAGRMLDSEFVSFAKDWKAGKDLTPWVEEDNQRRQLASEITH